MKKKKLALALQGGGGHGAFAWGVIDRLLQDGRVEITHLSGASAGGMNAVIAANGLKAGGPQQARDDLEAFWKAVAGTSTMLPTGVPLRTNGMWELLSGYDLMDMMGRMIPPSLTNPLKLNPLQQLVEKMVDFDRLNDESDGPAVYLSACAARTGKPRIFGPGDLSAKAAAASSCLPHMFPAVEIDGEEYWDGGYVENPPLEVLMQEGAEDTLIVQLNPDRIDRMPQTASEIQARANQIAFNASLQAKVSWVEQVNALCKSGHIREGSDLRPMRLHRIGGDGMEGLSTASKTIPDWRNFQELKEMGRRHAERWLETAFPDVGKKSTFTVGGTPADEFVHHHSDMVRARQRKTARPGRERTKNPAMA